jgi:hypothetical protein
MDENRLFTAGTTPGQTGYGHGSEYAMNMGAMVARDRNHPSALQKRTQSDLIPHSLTHSLTHSNTVISGCCTRSS